MSEFTDPDFNDGWESHNPSDERAITALRAEVERLRVSERWHHDALVRVAEALGVETPMQLIGLAENNEQTYVDLLLKFIAHKKEQAETEVERLNQKLAGQYNYKAALEQAEAKLAEVVKAGSAMFEYIEGSGVYPDPGVWVAAAKGKP